MSTDPQLRALVVYESMFGCTEQIALAVAEALRADGLAVEVSDVCSAPALGDAEFDFLVVGAPTHAFSLSRPATRTEAVQKGGRAESEATGLREWLTAGPSTDGPTRPAAAFDTRVTRVRRLPKAASTRAGHLLTHRGYELVSRPTPFLVEDTKGPLIEGEVERATEWGRTIAQAARRRVVPAG
jgi:hypothetical protein